MINNAKGDVFYGLHFYPGVAEYQEPGKDAYRVFLNEDTLRSMDPTFAGRPVFVRHVDEVEPNVDELRKEADGWVLESFFNKADGKHWAKFLVVSEKGKRAVKQGMRLSNSYFPKKFANGGLWNGVAYDKEITGGEYDHLAIVPDPRYEESVILTPDEFKKYNENKLAELDRLANSQKDLPMKLNFFKRAKVDNAVDIEGMSVVLPKSGKEMTITQLVTDADERLSNSPMAAHPEHLVDMGEGHKMTVNDLLAKHKQMCDELASMKAKNDAAASLDDPDESGDPAGGDVSMEGKDVMNAEDEGKDDDKDDEKKKNEIEAARKKADDKAKAKEKAERLRNAGPDKEPELEARVELSMDQVARGKARYGS